MIKFTHKHPRMDDEALGLIPQFFNEEDPRSAREQIAANYSFGGGWSPLSGWKMAEDGTITYGEGEDQDPPLKVLSEAKMRDETIRFYAHAWVAIVQPDGSYEVARID